MSLLAWYPFTGNMNNNGLSPCIITGSPSYSDDGKLGQCLSSSENHTLAVPGLSGSKVWSICFWGYVISSSITANWTKIIEIYDGGSRLRCEVCPKNNYSGIKCYSFHNNYGYNICTDCESLCAPEGGLYDRWTHVCLTSDGNTLSLYFDGEYKDSAIYDGPGTVTGTILIENNTSIKKNDFRVYDHCLSAREIKEISRGLILHYPLTGGGQGGLNLAINTNTDTDSEKFVYSEAVGDSTTTFVYEDGIACAKILRGETEHSGWSFLSYRRVQRSLLKPATWYTVSFDIKTSLDAWINLNGLMNGNATHNLSESVYAIQATTKANEWSHIIWKTKTIDSFDGDIKVNNQYIYMNCSWMNTPGRWMIMKNMKLEEGENDTPWSPNPSDAAYNQMGYGDGIAYDTSGNGYNGTKINTSSISDTIKYNSSTAFNGTDAYISMPTMTLDMSCVSFSVWCKFNSFDSWSRIFDFANSINGGTYDFELTHHSTTKTLYLCGRRFGHASLPDTNIKTIGQDIWYNIIVTINETNCKVYIDGKLEKDFEFNDIFGSPAIFNYSYLGKSNYTVDNLFNGNISDFRIYSTVLSDEDVKELYSQSAFIDNKGNIGCYEFVES